MRPPDDERLRRLEAEAGPSGRTAVELALAISRLRTRLRAESGMHSTGLTLSQLALIGRLIADGPTTAARLASAEHVSQQAIAQTLGALKAQALVLTERDPSDGRKQLLSATPKARELYSAMHESREAWLIRAIEATLAEDEQAVLVSATRLLERLAEATVDGATAPTPI